MDLLAAALKFVASQMISQLSIVLIIIAILFKK